MLEIEVKYPVPDFAPIEERLRAWGATPHPPRDDADHYYNAPHRDFAATDEAFRVRRIGRTNLVTYKGPKIDSETKTRTEVEVPLADGDEPAERFGQILKHLGFKPVAVVRKHRRIFECRRGGFEVHVSLDEVDRVGRYVELEIVAPEDRYQAAKAVLLAAASELGLSQVERRSYLELLLKR